MSPMISIAAVTKRYESGLLALDAVDLAIDRGEIFALLGPNGAGKTTLIGVICGTVSMTSGRVLVDGHDVVRDYRAARSIVGPRAAGDRPRHFHHRPAGGDLQPRPVRPAARPRLHRAAAARPLPVGEARHPDRRAVGRHEAARDDRQGARPRARRAVPRRTDGRRRRQPAPRHVGAGAAAAEPGRHRHSDHPLHRGGRGDGGPGRRHQPTAASCWSTTRRR